MPHWKYILLTALGDVRGLHYG